MNNLILSWVVFWLLVVVEIVSSCCIAWYLWVPLTFLIWFGSGAFLLRFVIVGRQAEGTKIASKDELISAIFIIVSGLAGFFMILCAYSIVRGNSKESLKDAG